MWRLLQSVNFPRKRPRKMTLGSLFSGIGGFELAAQWAGITPVWSNEIDARCCKVLRKRFTHEIIEGDIRECGAGRKNELQAVDIICGGFPCQPFSTAGQRKGKGDNRYLWPEMLRIISEVRPAWIVGENVAGILSMDDGRVFEEICNSLENEGYQVEDPFIIPAFAVGAPHRRDRVWIIAHAEHKQWDRAGKSWNGGRQLANCNPPASNANGSQDRISNEGQKRNSHKQRGILATWEKALQQANGKTNANGFSGLHRNVTHASKPGFQNGRKTQMGEQRKKQEFERCNGGATTTEQFNFNWLQVATSLCRMDDGLPAWVDSSRTGRLKALGNAIVPQIVKIIFDSILAVESLH